MYGLKIPNNAGHEELAPKPTCFCTTKASLARLTWSCDGLLLQQQLLLLLLLLS